jgi:type I restriction enzyme, S subunit
LSKRSNFSWGSWAMRASEGVVTFQQLIDAGVLEIGDGYRAQNSELGGTGAIFLRAGHVTDSHIDFTGVERFHEHLTDRVRLKMSRVGDTIITTKGNSTGRTSFVTDRLPPFVYSPHLSYWRTRDAARLCPGFLRYWSRSVEFTRQLSAMKTSTDMAPYLSLTDQRRLRVTLPSATDQRAIVTVLSSLDDKIELNRRMNTTLEAMARALFQNWFEDFDPVRAKLDGRRPAGLDVATAALFPFTFQALDEVHVPTGWSVGKIAQLASFSRAAVNPSRFPTEAFDHFSLPAFDNGRTPKMELGSAILSNKFTVPANAVLLSKLNPHIPRIWLPDLQPPRRSVCSTEFMVVCSKPGFSREYLYSLFSSSLFASTYATLVTGTTGSHQRITPESVLEMKVNIPPAALVQAFTEAVKPMFTRINQNITESRMLAGLRDTLLPKFLSGELSVGTIETRP